MTVAPHRSPQFRFRVILAFTVIDLVAGVLVLREFGVGPSVFLFALAAVGIVDLVLTSRRDERRTPQAPPHQ